MGVLLLLASIAVSAWAIYHDEAGQFDWHYKSLGYAPELQILPNRGVACGVAGYSTVGCISLQQGTPVWRKSDVPSSVICAHSIGHIAAHASSVVVALYSTGYLGAFDVTDGALLWQRRIGGDPSLTSQVPYEALATIATSPPTSVVGAMYGSNLKIVEIDSGRTQAELTLDTDGRQQTHSAVLEGKAGLCAVTGFESGEVVIHHVDSQWTLSGKQELEFQGTVGVVASGGNTWAALTDDLSTLCVVVCQGGEDSPGSASKCQSLGSVLSGLDVGDVAHVDMKAGDAGVVTLTTTNGRGVTSAALLQLQSDQVQMVAWEAANAVATQVVPTTRGPVAALIKADGSQVSLHPILMDKSRELGAQRLSDLDRSKEVGPRAAITHAVLGLSEVAGNRAFSVLFQAADGRMAFIEGPQFRQAWERPEGLAGVSSSVFVDFPPEGLPREEALRPPPLSLYDRARAQLLRLKVQYELSDPTEEAELTKLRELLAERNSTRRDPTGFRRVLILATAAPGLIAVHSGDGHVLWHRWVPEHVPDTCGDPLRVVLWQVPHSTEGHPQVAVFGCSSTDRSWMATLDPYTGELGTPQDTRFRAASAYALPIHPQVGHVEQHVYLLRPEGGGGDGVVLPATDDVVGALNAAAGAVTVMAVEKDGAALVGYRISHVTPTGAATLLPVWSHVAPPGARLLSMASKAANDATPKHARAVALPGQTLPQVDIKFTPPSLVVAVYGPAPGEDAGGLTVMLLEGVTGRVLHLVTHPNGEGPVHAAVGDNVAAYHFWDRSSDRWELAVLEALEAGQKPSMIDIVTQGFGAGRRSVYEHVAVEVISEAWFARGPLISLQFSRTIRGITAQQLLFAFQDGTLLSLDVRLMDPRRRRLRQLPIKGKMPPPISPVLPSPPTSMVTVDKEVHGLTAVHQETTYLESSYIVLAYGSDVFLSRHQPSGRYDVLPEGFPFALLLATCGLMTVLSIGFSYVSKNAQLKNQWL